MRRGWSGERERGREKTAGIPSSRQFSPFGHGLAAQVGDGHRLVHVHADIQAGHVRRLAQAGAGGQADELLIFFFFLEGRERERSSLAVMCARARLALRSAGPNVTCENGTSFPAPPGPQDAAWRTSEWGGGCSAERGCRQCRGEAGPALGRVRKGPCVLLPLPHASPFFSNAPPPQSPGPGPGQTGRTAWLCGVVWELKAGVCGQGNSSSPTRETRKTLSRLPAVETARPSILFSFCNSELGAAATVYTQRGNPPPTRFKTQRTHTQEEKKAEERPSSSPLQ
jgi:hypothetical protein